MSVVIDELVASALAKASTPWSPIRFADINKRIKASCQVCFFSPPKLRFAIETLQLSALASASTPSSPISLSAKVWKKSQFASRAKNQWKREKKHEGLPLKSMLINETLLSSALANNLTPLSPIWLATLKQANNQTKQTNISQINQTWNSTKFKLTTQVHVGQRLVDLKRIGQSSGAKDVDMINWKNSLVIHQKKAIRLGFLQ